MPSWSIFDLVSKESELENLQKASEAPDFWDDPHNAQAQMKKIASLERDVQAWRAIESELSGLSDLFELDDGSFTGEITLQLDKLEKELEKKEIQLLLSD